MRKSQVARAAPQGQQQPGMSFNGVQDATDFSNTWEPVNFLGNGNTPYNNASNFDNNYYGSDLQMTDMADSLPSNNALSGMNDPSLFSNQLVRMNRNNQMTVPDRTVNNQNWQDMQSTNDGHWEQHEEEEDLEQQAKKARKEAHDKKKSIPPFVLKLSSFLDKERNTDLIRWSDDGDSFIVLNEDEFAKTLIPELFKHNNYASFVRQLNMYGFHKKVGLSDNSMKSSESKVKNPSEYYNKYFKKGKPELLWLIQKPKNSAGSKRKRGDEEKTRVGDDDEDIKKPLPMETDTRVADEEVIRNPETALVSSREMTNIRSQLKYVQAQQQMMSKVIQSLKTQNDSLYQQARTFQSMHQQHENSINAILTFLASFYNRGLENNNIPDLATMFNLQQNNQQHRGNVVDMGDEEHDNQIHMVTPRRRQPLALLPAPEHDDNKPESPASRNARLTRSPSARPASRQSSIFKPVAGARSPSKAETPQIKTDAPSPNPLALAPENDEIMSLIRSSNAASSPQNSQSPQLDFSAAMNHLQQNADGRPLTPQQRNELLSRMAANSPTNGSPTPYPDDGSATPAAMPSLDDFHQSRAQLDELERLKRDTDDQVQHLADQLEPLNPTGTETGFITPLDDLTHNPYGNMMPGSDGDADFNSFLDPNFFPPDSGNEPFPQAGDMNIPGINFTDYGVNGADDLFGPNGVDYSQDLDGDSLFTINRVESVSSGAPSPANGDGSVTGHSQNNSPKKKRRKS